MPIAKVTDGGIAIIWSAEEVDIEVAKLLAVCDPIELESIALQVPEETIQETGDAWVDHDLEPEIDRVARCESMFTAEKPSGLLCCVVPAGHEGIQQHSASRNEWDPAEQEWISHVYYW